MAAPASAPSASCVYVAFTCNGLRALGIGEELGPGSPSPPPGARPAHSAERGETPRRRECSLRRNDHEDSTEHECAGAFHASLFWGPVRDSWPLRDRPGAPRVEGRQYPFYGLRRMTAQLHREGLSVNRKAVQRHMREMGIAGICPGPRRLDPIPRPRASEQPRHLVAGPPHPVRRRTR